MNEDLAKRPVTTVVTTGKGTDKAIIAGKPVVSSETGKVSGGNMVDVVFVFDTTGSMDDKISALLQTCAEFVDEAGKMKLEPQFSLISFGDISVFGGGDRIEVVVSPTENIEKIKQGLNHIPRNNGFGNLGESVLEAIDEAFKIQYREKAVKVMVVITDEPALQWATKVEKTISTMTQGEFLVFVVATDEPYYKEMALKNGGIWKEIGPDTDLAEILKLFSEMAKKVSQVAKNVHLIGKGSVREYLKLTSSK
ncbi:MAG TPA: vWA domain-containing protein [Patescibacteria group bacterium]|nr:vWA domain-containing protein [Patescibacteria group bacterium]